MRVLKYLDDILTEEFERKKHELSKFYYWLEF